MDSEWNGLFRMYWDGKALQVQPLDFGPGSISLQYGFEGSQFVPAGINSLPAVPQDSGAAGWTVYLDLNHDGKLDPGDPTAVTDSLGSYRFYDLPPGTYTVAELGQPGWRQTAPAGGTQTATVAPGQLTSGIDFGNTQLNAPASRPPAITSTPPTQATVGQLYRYDVAENNPDGQTLTFDLTSHPAGMVVDPATGVVVWTPTADEVGSQSAVLRVSDARGDVVLQDLAITVAPADVPPVITSEPPTQGAVRLTVQLPGRGPVRRRRSADLRADHGTRRDDDRSRLGTDPVDADRRSARTGGRGPECHRPPGRDGNPDVHGRGRRHAPRAAPHDHLATDFRGARPALSTSTPSRATDPAGLALTYSLTASPAGMSVDPASGLITWTPDSEPGRRQPRHRRRDQHGGRCGLADLHGRRHGQSPAGHQLHGPRVDHRRPDLPLRRPGDRPRRRPDDL